MFRKILTVALIAASSTVAMSLASEAYARDGGGPPPHVYRKLLKQQQARQQQPVSSIEREASANDKGSKQAPAKTSCRAAGGCQARGR